MSKYLLSVSLLAFVLLTASCVKKLDPVNPDGEMSFLVRLPSLSQARFEARCVSENIFLDEVKIQSPSASQYTENFDHQRIEKNEIFFVGNQAPEDGLWFITFVGTSALTNAEFSIIIPYEMVIVVDDNK